MSVRKCIAVIISRPDSDYQAALLRGILSKAFEMDYNVALFCTSNAHAFAESVKYPERIFDFAVSDKFSGIIYVPDSIYGVDTDAVTEKLRREAKCKVVVADKIIDGFTNVLCDDKSAVEKTVEHLIEKHGCKRIAYMTGIKGNPDAESRLISFRETMKKHNLDVDERLVFYGDFWYDEGAEVADMLIENEDGLPDAVVCASNRMACSVYRTFFKKGIKVPGDVRIAGYSDGFKWFDFLTTCCKNIATLGSKAVEVLLDGDLQSKTVRINECGELHLSFTCGCLSDSNDYYFEPNDRTMLEECEFLSIHNDMRASLQNQPNFTDFFWTIDWYTRFLNTYKYFSISISGGWDILLPDNKKPYNKNVPMNLILQHENFDDGTRAHSVLFDRKFDISDIHPVLWQDTPAPQAYCFIPFVSDDSDFGYVTLSYGSCLNTENSIFLYWLKDVINSFESQKRLFAMQYLYRQMSNCAVIDNMTSLGNRNGFNLKIEKLLSEAKQNGDMVAVIVGDLNCLKYINDTFGHIRGDNAIKEAANALSSVSVKGAAQDNNFRFGGDEFLKITSGNFTQTDVADCMNEIKAYLDNINDSGKYEYPIYLSLGCCVRDSNAIENIEEMISLSDMRMFENKERIKKETGFDYKR